MSNMTILLAMLGLLALSFGAMLLGWKSCDWWPKNRKGQRTMRTNENDPRLMRDDEGRREATRALMAARYLLRQRSPQVDVDIRNEVARHTTERWSPYWRLIRSHRREQRNLRALKVIEGMRKRHA